MKDWLKKLTSKKPKAPKLGDPHRMGSGSKLFSKIGSKFKEITSRGIEGASIDGSPSGGASAGALAALSKGGDALKKAGSGFYGSLLTAALFAHFTSDIATMTISELIPRPKFNAGGAKSQRFSARPFSDYQSVISRNLINSDGFIPGEGPPPTKEISPDTPPIKSTLGVNLEGTLVLAQSHLSIATILDKSQNKVFPVRINDEIPGLLKVTKIEPRKVIFLNLKANSRPEYIDIPDDVKITAPKVAPRSTVGGGVKQKAKNFYTVSRDELQSSLEKMDELLRQARAFPVPEGFKIAQIVSGSIFEKLGIQDNDIITAIDGDPIDPQNYGKIFELFTELKEGNLNGIELGVKRNGQDQNYRYEIQ